jgi:hypothetical protein
MARLLRSPATLVYVGVLAVTTAVLQLSSSHTAERLLQAHSTNLYHLARDPLRVLVTSAFWLASSWEVLAWAPLFLLVVAPIEARIGSKRTVAIFAVGHIGATLLTAAGLWVALHVDAVEHSIVHARDVGASYGFFAIAAAGTALLRGRARAYAVVAVVVYPVSMFVLSHDFTDAGHVLALAIGFLCARLGVVREEVDDQLALERVGDAQQRVDARRPAAALQPGDR